MALNLLRALMPSRVTHQRNAPTADPNGGDVPAWSNVATGLRCAIWPVETVPDLAEIFARRDLVTSHILAFAADIGALSSDRLKDGTTYYVVEGVEDFDNAGVLPHPVYLVAANLRVV